MSAPFPAMPLAQAHAMLTAPGQMFEMEHGARARPARRPRVEERPQKRLVDLWAAAAAHADKHLHRLRRRARHLRCVPPRVLRLREGPARRRRRRRASASRSRCATRPNGPIVFYGAALAGAVATPLNAWWTANELALRDPRQRRERASSSTSSVFRACASHLALRSAACAPCYASRALTPATRPKVW